MKFSLILATYGRTEPLYDLFDSLVKQEYKNFEVIVVDQNEDDRVEVIVEKYKDQLIIKHLKSLPGLSRARNVGLRVAEGDIVAFPDDDCTYYEDTLKSVVIFFERKSETDMVLGQIIDRNSGKKIIRKWPENEKMVNKNNFFMLCSSITIFARRQEKIFFDERLGVGADFGSCEDADYVFGFLINEKRAIYSPEIQVWHPELNNVVMPKSKVYNYGKGFGGFVKKHIRHHNIKLLLVKAILFHLIKGLFSLAKLDLLESKKRLAAIRGRIKGYFEWQ
jgi:glycosyltransferase involved in cell wall biosynthesis